MKHILVATLALLCAAHAEERGKLIFEDKFDRTESQEAMEEIGGGWTTNSKTRAGGHKQVDLKDGAMHITMHATADHAVTVGHAAEFRDGTVEMRFMLEDEKDVLGLDIADPQCKEVHAGHLFKIDVGTAKVVVDDKKSGVMNMKFYEARKAKTLTPEQLAFIASLKKTSVNTLEKGKWHDLLVKITGSTITVSIDGEQVASVTSEGVAHPTKRMIRLSVPRQAWVDDVRVFALVTATAK
jgi:DNA-binding XRE family transcriptional regulator